MTMIFPMILKSNGNSLNIKFVSLQQSFLKSVLRKKENKDKN